ncbi:MAG: Lrp/AsnC family transcriptional regulator [archaeon GB-1867-005]|nr:Lrp/AsnC family transcriptional regulator [Candidatus Culexmicrobium cathedralense]
MVRVEWRECPSYRKYVKAIDENCAKIISALNKIKSRNLSLIARETGMPPALVHYYYDKLARRGIIKLKAIFNFNKLGLTPVLLMAKVPHNLADKACEKLKVNDYWRTLIKSYTSEDVYCYGMYTIPQGMERKFEEFAEQLKRYKLIESVKLYWNPERICPNSNFQWFNSKAKKWEFHWKAWIEEVSKLLEEKRKYQVEREEEKEVLVPLDDTDIFIIRKLEEDAEITFKELAAILEVTPPTIRYHYYKHIVNYGVLIGYEPELYPYPKQFSRRVIVNLKFSNTKTLWVFLKSLENKPFTQQLFLHRKDLTAIMKAYLMLDQVIGFAKALSELTGMGVIAKYTYSIVDPSEYWTNLLPVQLYVKGKWKYQHEEYMSKVAKVE